MEGLLVAARRSITALFLSMILGSPTVFAEILFSEDFDSQPDWTSGLMENDLKYLGSPDTWQYEKRGHHLPENWESARQNPRWAPSTGHPDRHENIEILQSNSDKAREGKSLVIWRDSGGSGWKWNSDGILTKVLDEGQEKLYVEFWIRFSERWTPLGNSGATKLFRVASWDREGNIYNFGSDGASAPIIFWDYEYNQYGLRNKLAFRADPEQTNYKMTNMEPKNLPRTMVSGFMSLNFLSNIRDLNGDGVNDNVIDKLFNVTDGKPVGADGTKTTQDEFYGETWRKVAFLMEMNSSPGVRDGVLKQWIDGQLIFSNESVPWMGPESPGGLKWNIVHFGGNSHFHAYPDEDRREEWYAIDDIRMATEVLPEESNPVADPKPPIGLSAE